MAFMIEAMPSMRKKVISTTVSDSAPVIGRASSQTLARMAKVADASDHQKPGASRTRAVGITPMTLPICKQPAEADRDS